MTTSRTRTLLFAGALSALTILAPTAAHADAPYTQAAAHVAADGSLIWGKNITYTSSPTPGIYCVGIAPRILLDEETIIQATSQWASRSIGASPAPHGDCGNRPQTVTVWVKWALVHSHELAPGDFYLSIS